MASVKILQRSNPTDLGFSTNGVPSNNKQSVVAEVTGSPSAGLFSLLPKELGLTTIDFLQAEVVSFGTGTVPSVTTTATAQFLRGTNQVLALTYTSALQAAATGTVVLRVLATGDSVMGQELF